MNCEICFSSSTKLVGLEKSYYDYQAKIFVCNNCGNRFSPIDESVYESLHSVSGSYGFHKRQAKKIKNLFDKKNYLAIYKALEKNDRNKVLLEILSNLPKSSRVLEIGCSNGYIGAFCLLKELNYQGIDISKTAIDLANKLFGKKFYTSLSEVPFEEYDFIFHMGTIGCVKNPIEFNESLITKIKKGGKFFFNYPSLDFLEDTNSLWFFSTTAPDLNIAYKYGFWTQTLKSKNIEIEEWSIPDKNKIKILSKIFNPILFRSDFFLKKNLKFQLRMIRFLLKIFIKFAKISIKFFYKESPIYSEFNNFILISKK